MLLRDARLLGALVMGAVLCSCSAASDITAYEPLVGAETVAVTLQTSGVPLNGLPRLQMVGLTREVSVVWEVEDWPCLMASATAARAGSVIEIRLERAGNPLANCTPGRTGYRYAARVPVLTPGRYEVRLVDVFKQYPAFEVGRSSIVVGP